MRLSGSYTALFQRRAGARRQPGRVAHHQRRAAGRKQIGLQHLTCAAGPGGCRLSAAQASARGSRSVATTAQAAPRQHGGQHAGAGADVGRAPAVAAGSGACATRCTYSPRTGENTP
jgi:hypothetical protein